MSVIAPGGTLLPLPREIRDEIYGHYFEKSYIVLRSYYEEVKDVENWHSYEKFGGYADLALLRTSKAISADAKHFLFSTAASKATTFKYLMDLDPEEVFSTPPAKEDTDCMMNVEFTFILDETRMVTYPEENGYEDGPLYPAYHMDLLCEASIDHFVGTTVTRDALRIIFQVMCFDSLRGFFGPFIKTRFFQNLKSLNGFQRLALVLDYILYDSRKPRQESESRKVVEEVQKELEPHLGPSIVKDATHSFFGLCAMKRCAFELQFQPYRFYDCRAEAAKLEKEMDRIEG